MSRVRVQTIHVVQFFQFLQFLGFLQHFIRDVYVALAEIGRQWWQLADLMVFIQEILCFAYLRLNFIRFLGFVHWKRIKNAQLAHIFLQASAQSDRVGKWKLGYGFEILPQSCLFTIDFIALFVEIDCIYVVYWLVIVLIVRWVAEFGRRSRSNDTRHGRWALCQITQLVRSICHNVAIRQRWNVQCDVCFGQAK